MAEKFDLLIYKGGKIWLGYHDEISLLMDDQEGELLELTCVKTSYLGLAI